MKKITQELILEKKQYLHILNSIAIYSPRGLSLHELTYLLTNNNNMYKMSLLHKNFGNLRKDIFKTRQRIYDCITNLINLNLIYKTKNKYHLNLNEFHLLFVRVKYQDELKKIEEQTKVVYKKIEDKMRNLSYDERKNYELEFWKRHEKNIFKNYLKK